MGLWAGREADDSGVNPSGARGRGSSRPLAGAESLASTMGAGGRHERRVAGMRAPYCMRAAGASPAAPMRCADTSRAYGVSCRGRARPALMGLTGLDGHPAMRPRPRGGLAACPTPDGLGMAGLTGGRPSRLRHPEKPEYNARLSSWRSCALLRPFALVLLHFGAVGRDRSWALRCACHAGQRVFL